MEIQDLLLYKSKMFHQINQIPILNILSKLGIEYKRIGHKIYSIKDGDKFADWWIYNETGNFINDFSGKYRARWSPYSFVKQYLELSDKEVFIWFMDSFNIKSDGRPIRNRGSPKQKKNKVIRPYSRHF